MKRFVADAILILVIVAIAFNSSSHEETTLESKQKAFEESILNNETITTQVETTQLHDINDNLAVRFANATSDVIVDVTSNTLGIIVSIVQDVLK